MSKNILEVRSTGQGQAESESPWASRPKPVSCLPTGVHSLGGSEELARVAQARAAGISGLPAGSWWWWWWPTAVNLPNCVLEDKIHTRWYYLGWLVLPIYLQSNREEILQRGERIAAIQVTKQKNLSMRYSPHSLSMFSPSGLKVGPLLWVKYNGGLSVWGNWSQLNVFLVKWWNSPERFPICMCDWWPVFTCIDNWYWLNYKLFECEHELDRATELRLEILHLWEMSETGTKTTYIGEDVMGTTQERSFTPMFLSDFCWERRQVRSVEHPLCVCLLIFCQQCYLWFRQRSLLIPNSE